MTPLSSGVIRLPFGCLALYATKDLLVRLEFVPPDTRLEAPHSEIARQVEEELRSWCNNPLHVFRLPYSLETGTAFQRRVWKTMCEIPLGETRSYGAIADQLHSSPRAVGSACGRNPIPIIIPCHRITAKHNIGGFNQSQIGWLIAIKHWLLTHEQSGLKRSTEGNNPENSSYSNRG